MLPKYFHLISNLPRCITLNKKNVKVHLYTVQYCTTMSPAVLKCKILMLSLYVLWFMQAHFLWYVVSFFVVGISRINTVIIKFNLISKAENLQLLRWFLFRFRRSHIFWWVFWWAFVLVSLDRFEKHCDRKLLSLFILSAEESFILPLLLTLRALICHFLLLFTGRLR